MNRLHERIRYQVRETLCPVCVFQGADGTCHTPDPDGCAILRNIPEIVEVVQTIDSPKMDPYVDALREIVCANCHNQDAHGDCRLRGKADCSLDDYFGIVVDIVERELEQSAAERPDSRAG